MSSQGMEADSPLLAKDDHNTEKGQSIIAECDEKHNLRDYKVEAWR